MEADKNLLLSPNQRTINVGNQFVTVDFVMISSLILVINFCQLYTHY